MATLLTGIPDYNKDDLPGTVFALYNNVMMLRKELKIALQSLDSQNVSELITNYTKIKSEDGSTEIKGNILEMTDTSRVRLVLGYDIVTKEFKFELYDTNGVKTVYVNSDGEFRLSGKPLLEMKDDQAVPVTRLKMGYDPDTSKFVFVLKDASGNETIYLNDEGVAVFAGVLSAEVINAIKAEIDVVVTNTFVTQTLYAEYGRIANLTVAELNTSWKKITNYLSSDTSDVNYIRAYEQNIHWITAATDGLSTEQVTNYDDEPLYWTDDTHTGMTTDVTDYPVTIYVYTELTKAAFSFEMIGEYYIPVIKLGAGAGVEGHPDYGKGFIYKEADGLLLKYITTAGTEYSIKLGEDGIIQTNNTGSLGLRNIAVGTTAPTTPQTNDLWIDTDA